MIAEFTSAAIISPFQSASTLSSRPGRMRSARASSKIVAQAESRPRRFAVRHSFEPVENIVALEVSFVSHIVVARKEFAGLGSDQFDDFIFGPDVELAFFAFRNRHQGKPRMRPRPVVISRLSHSTVSRARRANSGLPLRRYARASNSSSCALS